MVEEQHRGNSIVRYGVLLHIYRALHVLPCMPNPTGRYMLLLFHTNISRFSVKTCAHKSVLTASRGAPMEIVSYTYLLRIFVISG